MGEIADMMISGLLCQTCGVLIDGEEPGYPRFCTGCDTTPLKKRSFKRKKKKRGSKKSRVMDQK